MPRSNSFLLGLVCVLGIMTLELYAINRGMNGTCFTAAIAAITALGGATLPKLLGKGDKHDKQQGS